MKKVIIKGNRETFVEPLMEFCVGLNGNSGYYHIQAELKRNKQVIVQEGRDVFVQNILDLNLPERNIYYVDGENIIPYYLDKRRTFWYPWQQKFSHFHKDNLIFIFHRYTGKKLSDVLDMVYKGDANLIWLEHDMEYARHILNILIGQNLLPQNAEPLAYPNKAWLGGWQFCKKHPIFDGLPSPAIFNWEYGEVFAPWGIKNFSGETIAGICNAPPVMATTIGIIHCGKGNIIFCSLNLTQLLGKNPAADRIFAQLIKFAVK